VHARPDLTAATVDLDLGDDRDHRTRALGIGDTASRQRVAGAVGERRRAGLPAGALGCRLDDGDVARCSQIAQAEGGDPVGSDLLIPTLSASELSQAKASHAFHQTFRGFRTKLPAIIRFLASVPTGFAGDIEVKTGLCDLWAP
jgi:hypothetical protein